jgi:hypothetical protein
VRRRFSAWGWQFLIAVDQLAGVTICFWTFVVFGRGEAPNADETISSRVGRNAVEGKRWALICERLIDGIFGAGHCRRSIGH